MWNVAELTRAGVDFAPQRNSFTYTFPPPHIAKARGQRKRASSHASCRSWPDASLYVHVPFCELDCDFCSLHREVLRDSNKISAYVDALLRELTICGQLLDSTPLIALYVGGGTPTLLGRNILAAILDTVARSFSCTPDIEVTVECAPTATRSETDWREYFGALLGCSLPVTRISLGAQSFDERVLRRMGRRGGLDALLTVLEVVDGLPVTYNIDLILGYPESRAGIRSSEVVSTLLDGISTLRDGGLRLPSLSVYQLWDTSTIRLGREGSVQECNVAEFLDAKWALQQAVFGFGYTPTIVSTVIIDPTHTHRWAKHRHQSFRHLGTGSGSYSILPSEFSQRPRDIDSYIAKTLGCDDPFADDVVYSLDTTERFLRAIIMGLRTFEWIDMLSLQMPTAPPGEVVQTLNTKLDALCSLGVVDRLGSHLRLRKSAFMIANEISSFLHPGAYPRTASS